MDLGPKITNEDWQKEQANDPHIGRVLELMKQDKLMNYKSIRNDPSGLRVYLKFRKDLILRNKLLCCILIQENKTWHIVLRTLY